MIDESLTPERHMIDLSPCLPKLEADAPWHASLDKAATVGEAVSLVREFLAAVPPEKLARLPQACRDVRVKAEDDIEYWTFRLSDAHRLRDLDPPGAGTLRELFSLLLHASLRIALIDREQAGGVTRAQ